MIKMFSYGSNMSLQRLRKRVPSAVQLSIGYVEGYSLKCFKKSKDGSGKASIIPTNNKEDKVWGVIFMLEEKDKPNLDKAEGLGYGYNEIKVDVVSFDATTQCQVYIADNDYLNETLVPYNWYKSYIVNGAKQYNLPSEYIETLESIKSVQDINVKRRNQNVQ